MILLLIEMISCGYLGYKRFAWWIPAVVALFGFTAFQFFALDGRMDVANLLTNMITSYLGFGIGLGIRKLMNP
jgi:hypothetical protein